MALSVGTPTYLMRPQARGKKIGWVNITFDSSYAAGGEAIAYTDIDGLGAQLDGMVQIGINNDAYHCHYDSTAGTLVANAVGAEGSGDLSALIVKMLFIGA
jgi:hypothetical protein